MMMVWCNAMSMPVDDNASSSSSNSGGASCRVMGSSHPHMLLVCCNTMEWTDKTEEVGLLKMLVTSSDPVAGTTVVTEGQAIQRERLTGRRLETLHGAQVVLEAVAGNAAHSDAQEQPDNKSSGAHCQAPAQEGAAGQGAQLECTRVWPFKRWISDAPAAARQGVPELGMHAHEEQGRETAVAWVPAEGHLRVGEPSSAPEAVGTARSMQGSWHVHIGVRGREQHLDWRRGRRRCVSCGSAAAVCDEQALADEEAKVGVQCYKKDGTTAFVVPIWHPFKPMSRSSTTHHTPSTSSCVWNSALTPLLWRLLLLCSCTRSSPLIHIFIPFHRRNHWRSSPLSLVNLTSIYLYVNGADMFMNVNICMGIEQTRLYSFTTKLQFPSGQISLAMLASLSLNSAQEQLLLWILSRLLPVISLFNWKTTQVLIMDY